MKKFKICSRDHLKTIDFFPPPIAFFVFQKDIEGGLEEIVGLGLCVKYSVYYLYAYC